MRSNRIGIISSDFLITLQNSIPAIYFFVLTQKSNKKSQGCWKKAKIYFITLKWTKSIANPYVHDWTIVSFNNLTKPSIVHFLTLHCINFLTLFFKGRFLTILTWIYSHHQSFSKLLFPFSNTFLLTMPSPVHHRISQPSMPLQ